VTEAADDERRVLARVLRQSLESLGRAGVDRIPIASLGAIAGPIPARPASPAPRPAPAAPAPRSPEVGNTLPTPPPSRPAEPPPPRVERPTLPPPVAASLFGEPGLAEVVPETDRAPQLAVLAAEVSRCTRCAELAATRKQTVFGEGSVTARLMFIGEAPGADEDETGRPFVGRSGALLTDMIGKGMGIPRAEVYIANILKSRPPGNRTPEPEEVANCIGYLERQVAIIRPQFLCLLGKTAASVLLETALPLGKLRGKWHRYRGIPTIVTYHPSALLRNPAWKKDAWEDLQILMQAMGIKPPDRKRPG